MGLGKYDYAIRRKQDPKKEEQIRPHMPAQQEFESFVNVIGKKYKILAEKKVHCAMDGLKLYLQEAGNIEIQE
eukprot:3734784-Ditylum_brightwellii.AAC.1